MPENSNFVVRFWGVRGSIACAGPETMRYGGNTACIEMRCGDRLIVFDAGTGIRPLGLSIPADQPIELDHFFSHAHWDHIVGLPFFRPAHIPGNKIRIRSGHHISGGGLENALREAMHDPLFPIPLEIFKADLDFINFNAGDTLDIGDGISVRTAPLNHPNGCTGYRVTYDGKSVCYVTDTEHIVGKPDQVVLDLIDGADIVIYDATYTDEEFEPKIGWGHSTWQEGVRLCKAAGARRLVLFHHDPDRDDHALDEIEVAARGEFDLAIVAHEGLALAP